MLILFGTEEQKRVFLPSIGRGKIQMVSGIQSEMEAGSDLALMKSKAVKDSYYFVINGGKV